MSYSASTRRLFAGGFFVALTALACTPALAVPIQLDFSGQVAVVETDVGSTSFSGTTVGDFFSFSITYDSVEGDFSFCDAINSCAYVFLGPEYGGSIGGGQSISGQSALAIQNDYSFSQSETPLEDLAIANAILDPDITVNTPFDFWQVGSASLDESTFFAFSVLTLDTSLRTSPDFDPAVPAAGADAIVFILEEETFSGEFSAIGVVDNFQTTIVPLPAAGWLLFGALGALGGFARRRSARGCE
jgi:hypothetical protein